MTESFNRTSEKANRRKLRKDAPKAEVLVWSRIRGRQILGFKFQEVRTSGEPTLPPS